MLRRQLIAIVSGTLSPRDFFAKLHSSLLHTNLHQFSIVGAIVVDSDTFLAIVVTFIGIFVTLSVIVVGIVVDICCVVDVVPGSVIDIFVLLFN